MSKLLPIIAIFSLIIAGVVARADDRADLDKTVAGLNAQAQTNAGRQRVLDAISKETGVPVTTLQAQQSKTRFGFGELLIANSLAAATGKSFDEIANLKTSGKGWGKIAKENNINLGKIVSKALRAHEAAQHLSDKGGKAHGDTSGSHGGGAVKPSQESGGDTSHGDTFGSHGGGPGGHTGGGGHGR